MKGSYKLIATVTAVVALGGTAAAVAHSDTDAKSRDDKERAHGAQLSRAEQDALTQALSAVAGRAPRIVKPKLDAAVRSGSITAAQERALLSTVATVIRDGAGNEDDDAPGSSIGGDSSQQSD